MHLADIDSLLPDDGTAGVLVGRVWDPSVGGPSVVTVRDEGVIDLSASFGTIRALTETPDPGTAAGAASGPVLGSLADLLANPPVDARDPSRPWLLSPIDLQVIKA